MNQHEISALVAERFIGSSGLLPVKHDRKYNFDYEDAAHITYFVRSNEPESMLTGGDNLRGLITVLVNYENSKGSNFGEIEGQKVADLFPKFSEFSGIRIIKRPHVQGKIDKGDGWWYTPVSISYEYKDC